MTRARGGPGVISDCLHCCHLCGGQTPQSLDSWGWCPLLSVSQNLSPTELGAQCIWVKDTAGSSLVCEAAPAEPVQRSICRVPEMGIGRSYWPLKTTKSETMVSGYSTLEAYWEVMWDPLQNPGYCMNCRLHYKLVRGMTLPNSYNCKCLHWLISWDSFRLTFAKKLLFLLLLLLFFLLRWGFEAARSRIFCFSCYTIIPGFWTLQCFLFSLISSLFPAPLTITWNAAMHLLH
jgi:hypothetical protein